MRLNASKIFCGGCALAFASLCNGQFGRGDSTWTTAGADAQRSSWVRTDAKISKDSVQKPDFRFLWKVKLTDKSGKTNTLTPAVLLNKYIGYRGFRDLAIVESNGDSVYGIDVDLGRIEWNARIKPAVGAGAANCQAGLMAGLARPTLTAFPGAPSAFGQGRSSAAKSGVGEAGEGAVTLTQTPVVFRPPTPAATPGAPRIPTRRSPISIYVIGDDGMFHTMLVSNGAEPEPPVPFVPAKTSTSGFIVANDVAYVATKGCGSEGNGVRALDLTSKEVSKWDATSRIAGSEGPAFGPDGTLFAATEGGDLVALDSKGLAVKDTYNASPGFMTSPLVFQYRQKVLAVAAGKDGSLHLVDTKSLGGEDHKTPLFKTAPGAVAASVSALASFQDAGGRRWILAPTTNAIAAWQIDDQNGALSLIPGWTSREMASPSSAMVINGVVFAYSNGGSELANGAGNSVLYAFDSATGKDLWNSGSTIASAAHHGSLSAGGSQLYLGADDGSLYVFGVWIERQ